MRARCRWNSEVIVMTSARWGRMKTGRCLNIHPKRLASNSDDPMFLGCSEDILSLMDSKCSSKPVCDVVVPNPDLDQVTPCYEDLTRYLEASYTCVKGAFTLFDCSCQLTVRVLLCCIVSNYLNNLLPVCQTICMTVQARRCVKLKCFGVCRQCHSALLKL